MIKAKFFPRGLHLCDRKRSASRQITTCPPPAEVAIPLSQHIGAPAVPVVRVGEQVKRGQLLAGADGLVSANVHASIAGRVTAIEERTLARGRGTVVVIARSERDEKEFMPPLKEPTAEQIRERVFDAGIVGMGGAGFPTHVKLQPKQPISTLVLNGAECEPYLTCDHRLMVEQTEKIVRGAGYLARAVGAGKIFIGIEKNKPDALARFCKTKLKTVALKKRYPMGSEKHLVYAVTGRKIPLGKLPTDVGVLVDNVATAFAVCEAVEEGKPLLERVFTLSGDATPSPQNLLLPVGTPLSTLVESAQNAVKFVLGGPMTGTAITELSLPVTKTSAGLLLLTKGETCLEKPTPCINCGRCAEVCPMHLMPMQTEFYAARKEYALSARYGGVLSCIECGACSYICPARRPLAQAISRAKAELKKQKEKG